MRTGDYDVLVLGAGLAGLTCATLLAARPALRIGVVDRIAPPPFDGAADIGLRVLAIAPGPRAVLEACGAWPLLPASRLAPYRAMHVWQGAGGAYGPRSIHFDAAEMGRAELGHIVEHDALRDALTRRAATAPNIELAYGCEARALSPGRQRLSIHFEDGRVLAARLVVGADGAQSWLRHALRVPVNEHSYRQRALVTHVRSRASHREVAWQCFTPQGPLALLPLADGRYSVVWSTADRVTTELMALDDATLSAHLSDAMAPVPGPLEVVAPRATFPLAARHARRYTGARFALIGDAAHQVHPLAGQGINLGLLDAAVLAGSVLGHLGAEGGTDPGDVRALRRYERGRKGANQRTLAAMDALNALFDQAHPWRAGFAGSGMGVVDRLPAVKRMLAAQAMGLDAVAGGRPIFPSMT